MSYSSPHNARFFRFFAQHWIALLSALLISCAIAAWFVWPAYHEGLNRAFELMREGDIEQLRQWIAGFGAIGPVLIVLMMVVQMFLIVVPSWLLMLIAILAYGPVAGVFIAVVAVVFASLVGYGIGHAVGSATLQRLLGKKTAMKVKTQVEQYGLWAVVITRINPLLSNDAISFVGGMLDMGLLRFLLATVAGILPLAIALAVLGENWQEIQPLLLGVSISGIVLILARMLWKRYRGVRE